MNTNLQNEHSYEFLFLEFFFTFLKFADTFNSIFESLTIEEWEFATDSCTLHNKFFCCDFFRLGE